MTHGAAPSLVDHTVLDGDVLEAQGQLKQGPSADRPIHARRRTLPSPLSLMCRSGVTDIARRNCRRDPSEIRTYASDHALEIVQRACTCAYWRRQVNGDGRYYDLGQVIDRKTNERPQP